MKLITKAIAKKLPKLNSQENNVDPKAIVKFFQPWGEWTWYGIEWDGEDMFFGYVVGWEKELGYFSLKELKSLKGPFGLKIERDLWWSETKLSNIKKMYKGETNDRY